MQEPKVWYNLGALLTRLAESGGGEGPSFSVDAVKEEDAVLLFKEASYAMRQAAHIRPSTREAWHNLGHALHLAATESLSSQRGAKKQERARAGGRSHEPEEAIAAFRAAIALAPQDPKHFVGLARCLEGRAAEEVLISFSSALLVSDTKIAPASSFAAEAEGSFRAAALLGLETAWTELADLLRAK